MYRHRPNVKSHKRLLSMKIADRTKFRILVVFKHRESAWIMTHALCDAMNGDSRSRAAQKLTAYTAWRTLSYLKVDILGIRSALVATISSTHSLPRILIILITCEEASDKSV